MFPVLARFVTRMVDPDDGLIIGVTMKQGRQYFEPKSVYELRDVMGEHQLMYAGPCNPRINWNRAFHDIISEEGKYLYLTADEYAARSRKR